MKHFAFLIPLLLPLLFSCGGPKPEKAAEPTAKPRQEPAKVPAPAAKVLSKSDQALLTEVDSFLRFYTQGYLALQKKSAEADWALNTVIVEGDDKNSKAYEKAEGELAQYTGSVEMIKKAKRYLEREAALTDLQVRQLKAVLYAAARSPHSTIGTTISSCRTKMRCPRGNKRSWVEKETGDSSPGCGCGPSMPFPG